MNFIFNAIALDEIPNYIVCSSCRIQLLHFQCELCVSFGEKIREICLWNYIFTYPISRL